MRASFILINRQFAYRFYLNIKIGGDSYWKYQIRIEHANSIWHLS